MKNSILHIKKPSKGLLKLVRKIQEEKEERQKEIKANWATYFPEK